jgi:hypothetical protein
MASLGFPVIVSISFHSTTGHRYAWEIQVRALGTGKTYADKHRGQVTQFGRRIYLGYDQSAIGCSSSGIPPESFILHLQLNR